MDLQDAVDNSGLTDNGACWGTCSEQVSLKVSAAATLPDTVADWPAEFCRLANRSKPDTFELANAAFLTRKRLARGEWAKFWRSGTIPFSKTKGEALVRIGERFGIPNVQSSACLPVEWTILRQLARLSRPHIETLIAQKDIRRDLTYKEARELVITILGTRRPVSAHKRVQRRFVRLQHCVREQAGHLSRADRDELATQLQELARELMQFRSSAPPGGCDGIIALPLDDVPANRSQFHNKAL